LRFPLPAMIILFSSLAIMLTLLVVLERVGASVSFVGQITLLTIWLSTIFAGFMGANMRPSAFFLGGRQLGIFSIAAIHGLLIIIVFAPELDRNHTITGTSVLATLGALIITGSMIAPQFRASGCYTPIDFMRRRFQHWIPAFCTGLASLISLSLLARVAWV
jgi:hypothetical protein